MFLVNVDWGVGVVCSIDEYTEYRLGPCVNPVYDYRETEKNRKQIPSFLPVLEIPELKVLC